MDSVSANLFKLWQAGTVYLPLMAEIYSNLSGSLHSTEGDEFVVFSMPGTNEPAPVLNAWIELRSMIQKILDDTCLNLLDTGRAVLGVVDDYIASDRLTADEITALNAEIEDYPMTVDEAAERNPYEPLDTPPEGEILRPDGTKEKPELNEAPERSA